MQGGSGREHRHQLVRIHGGQLLGVQAAAQAVLEVQRGAEGPLERDLLVQDHADQQRQWILREEAVGVGILAQVQGNHGPTVVRPDGAQMAKGRARLGALAPRLCR